MVGSRAVKFYRFDGVGAEPELMPLAARRALVEALGPDVV